ncbi:hypothetical protein [Streptomyces sp. NPDC089795]|uniref:hypothetical protein n=1 Tax=Streptomyces sp. NPDC089795 TaxID=3155297 RepID=UPI003445B689
MTSHSERDVARHGRTILQMPQQAPPIDRSASRTGTLIGTAGVEASRIVDEDSDLFKPWQPAPPPYMPDEWLDFISP